MRDGGLFNGHYFSVRTFLPTGEVDQDAFFEAYAAAMADYMERCIQLKVDPIPAEGIQSIPAGVPRPSHGCRALPS